MMSTSITRREWMRNSAKSALGIGLTAGLVGCDRNQLAESEALAMRSAVGEGELFFQLSLAQWSLHRTFWGGLDNLEFASKARTLGFSAVEYVNQFFADKGEDEQYLSQMKQRADDQGVTSVLIMVDGEGVMGHADESERLRAVDAHKKWVRAAKFLGCHSIRVNAQGKGEADDVAARVIDSLGTLASYAASEGINIIVENHGGYSSNGAWLADVMSQVGMENCGTLPDFGNFTMSLFPRRRYDSYRGVAEMMPWAKGVSAKAYDFTGQGEDTVTDFKKMLTVVRDAGYRGYIGVEYEGSRLSEEAGILATRNLLLRYGKA